MTDREKMNGVEYWDNRFDTDWESKGGREQSRFFARVAIGALPQWLIHKVRWDDLSVCDWGCAQGDGTEMLNQLLSWNVTGMDFSKSAIESAAHAYPAIRFLHGNLLEKPDFPMFDVMFSSNTLEHFEKPWSVFEKISLYAAKFVVLLLPYREYERHIEHEVTFDAKNIPLVPGAEWVLVYESVVDTRICQPTYWNGDQILLIYARTAQLDRQLLSLADARISGGEVDDVNTHAAQALVQVDEAMAQVEVERSRAEGALARSEADKARLQELVDERVHWMDTLRQRDERIHYLQYREQALMAEMAAVLATRSWRLTAPLRAIRRIPGWMRRRMNDVKCAYLQGGVRHVVQRSLRYVSKHLKQGRQSASAAGISGKMGMKGGISNQSVYPGAGQFVAKVPHALPDVFVFSIIDWHFRIQRPQHLAREFARAGHRVYFFSNHFIDAAKPGYTIEKLDDALDLYQIKLNVHRAPSIYFAAPGAEAIEQIGAGMRLFFDWSGTDRSWSIVQHGYWYPIAAALQSECLAYDCMDHHEGFGKIPRELLVIEERMMEKADLLVVTSSWLEDHARKHNLHVALIRNAGQYEDFCEAPAERFIDPRGRRIIGYYGAIAEWFDVELVAQIAKSFPDALVLLVGADSACVGDKLKQYLNVQMTGEVPYARLPYYLYAFDVCLMPFRVVPLTLATNPVKIYEYLGAGCSVVSVNLPEMTQFGDLIRIADTPEGFIDQVGAALDALPDSKETIASRKAFAAGQTWSHRVDEFCDAINTLPLPKVSVIVLTYNNLDLTKACLDSLERHSNGVDLEIVIVDNASSDGSPAFLSAWAASRTNVTLILDHENRGFAIGNNQGLAAATGDYLVILNNDTVVTQNWARRMVNHLRNNPDIGIIGPVTNNIGNEARIDTRYESIDEMHVEAEILTNRSLGQCFELNTVAFFCAMLPRSTYQRCGPMSEDYGMGFFEDDDYCRRVQGVGLRVVCAEDVFVHHHLSASFNKLGEERKRSLFEINRRIYEAKWGPWTPHRHRQKASGAKDGTPT